MSAQSTAARPDVSVPAVPASRPSHRRSSRICGAVGIGGGLLFAAMTVWEHGAGLESGGGVAGALNGGGFALAMTGYVVLAVGLLLDRPGGGRIAAIFPALVAVAWTAFVTTVVLEALLPAGSVPGLLYPLGGLGQAIGLLGLGVTVAVVGRWSGWRRFYASGFAAYYVGALFVPAIAGIEPTTVLEVGWALGYAVLGLALMTAGGPSRIASVATAVLSVGLIGAAVLVMTTRVSAPPESQSVPVVHDGRSGGPDVDEPLPNPIFENGRQGASIFDSTDTVYPGRRPS